jgi:hypothetical protein
MPRADGIISAQPMTIDARLHTAIRKLRAQCNVGSPTNPERCCASFNPLQDTSKRLEAFQDILVRARAREADLEDEIETLKCQLTDSQHHIRELESAVDDWRKKYFTEVARSRERTAGDRDPEDTNLDRFHSSMGTFEQTIIPAKTCEKLVTRLESPIANGGPPRRHVYDLQLNSFLIPDVSKLLRPCSPKASAYLRVEPASF